MLLLLSGGEIERLVLAAVHFIPAATTASHRLIGLLAMDHGGHFERRTFPIVSEFETVEQAASYDRWFSAKVQASLDDPRPNVPHDQVMADMRALIESKRNKRDAG